MNIRLSQIILFAFLAFLNLQFLAGQSGDKIIQDVEIHNHVDSSRMSLTMTVYPDRRNERSARRFVLTGYGRGSEESMMIFTEPRSLNGLSLLSVGNDQWIYFPSTGRVRKIAGRSKDDTVQGVGGDFSYEDLSAGEWTDKYTFSVIEEDRREWILRGIPVRESSYSQIEVTVDKRLRMIVRVLYWKDDDNPVKELILEDIRNIGGRDTPAKTVMIDRVKDSMTVIETGEAEWNIPLTDSRFNPNRFWK